MDYVLYHISKFDSIKSIINSMGFKASYCKEKIEYFFQYKSAGAPFYYLIPMVSFTDFPLESILLGKSTYGNCAIGLDIEWGKKKELNPVLYLEKHSKIAKSIYSILNTGIDNQNTKIDLAATILMQSIKNFDGELEKSNAYINYYEEREWRFVPSLKSSLEYPPYYIGSIEIGQKPHIIEEEHMLKFDIGDIKYIVLENIHQQNEIADLLTKNGVKFSKNIFRIT